MTEDLSEKLIDLTPEERIILTISDHSKKSPSSRQTIGNRVSDRRGLNISRRDVLCSIEAIILENPVDKQKHSQIIFYGNIVLLYVWLFSAALVGIGISGIITYAKSVADVTPSIYVVIGLCAVRGLFELQRVVFSNKNRANHCGNLVDCLNCMGICLVLLFYFIGAMSSGLFVALMASNVSVQLFVKPFFRTYLFFFLDLLFNLLNSIGMMLICLKLAYPSDFWSWNVMLIWYTIINYCTTGIGGAATFIAVLAFPFKKMKIGPIWKKSYFVHAAIVILALFVACISFCLFLSYIAIKTMLVNGDIRPLPVAKASLPFTLILAAYFQISVGGVLMLAVLFVKIFQRRLITRIFLGIEKKRIIKKKYNQSFELKLFTIDGQYFQSLDGHSENQTAELKTCVICQSHPSNVLIRPCNHAAICAFCLPALLGGPNKCPVCKSPFEKCHSLQFNQEAGYYEVVSTMQLKEFDSHLENM